MFTPKVLRSFFARERHPGDLVFAVAFLLLSLLLLAQIGSETQWVKRAKLFAQPAFWPAVGLIGMTAFASLHLISSLLSRRSQGRARELWVWAHSLEYTLWFMAYVVLVPYIGYLAATLLFTVSLTFRAGYRAPRPLIAAALSGFFIVLIFKGLLAVKIPGGAVYEYLPNGMRNLMLLYF